MQVVRNIIDAFAPASLAATWRELTGLVVLPKISYPKISYPNISVPKFPEISQFRLPTFSAISFPQLAQPQTKIVYRKSSVPSGEIVIDEVVQSWKAAQPEEKPIVIEVPTEVQLQAKRIEQLILLEESPVLEVPTMDEAKQSEHFHFQIPYIDVRAKLAPVRRGLKRAQRISDAIDDFFLGGSVRIAKILATYTVDVLVRATIIYAGMVNRAVHAAVFIPIHTAKAFFRTSIVAVRALGDGMVRLWNKRPEISIRFTIAKPTFRLPKPAFTQHTKRNFAPALRFVGNSMIGVSLFGVIFFGAPYLALELRGIVFRMTQSTVTQADPLPAPTVQPLLPDEQIYPDKDKLFRIRIPMIGVDANVIANVDAGTPQEYEEALKHGVAHAKGTGLPGEDGGVNKSIFIFSHSTNGSWNITRYNALFYSLKDLKEEDQIQIWFWGKEYWYKVVEKKIVENDDTSFLQPQMDKERLILQTCFPPGTVSKRLIIIAEPVGR